MAKMTISEFFPPEAGEKEFVDWVTKEVRKDYPKGKILPEFKVESQKNEYGDGKAKNRVTANVTIIQEP